MDGFVFLWRQSIESEVFQSAELWHLWTWCLMRANHKDKFVPVKTGKGTVTAKVGPGQFVFGRHRAAEALNCSPSSIRNRMLKLQEMGNISMESNSQFSIVTICNWEHYQGEEKKKGQPKDKQRTTKGQPEDTDNNVKNVEEVITYLNAVTDKNFKPSADSSKKYITARLREGYSMEDFKAAIDNQWQRWRGTDMEQYMRPKTLFNSDKFDGYVNNTKSGGKGYID